MSDIIIRRRASASPAPADLSQTYDFFATTGKGIEDVLADELRALGVEGVSSETGGARFRGTLADCYRANLWLRTANRVLLFLAEFPCNTPEELYDGVRTIRWNDFLNPDMTLAVDCTVRDSAITHSGFAALKTKDAVVDVIREQHGRRPNVDTGDPSLRINIRLFRNRCTVSLDSSGVPLDRRGYRLARREAPLRENLAAALVLLTGWDASLPLMDPMCGSGTIPIEAAMIAARRAPGLGGRTFGFSRWSAFDSRLWAQVVEEAKEQALSSLPSPVLGSDVSAAALATALQNARSAGVDGLVMWQKGDMLETAPPSPGVILFNPPYGRRLGEVEELKQVYRQIGDFLKRRCTGSTAYILVGDLELAKHIGLKAARRMVVYNGPIECRLLKYELY